MQHALDSCNRKKKRFYEECKKQHFEIDALHQEMKTGMLCRFNHILHLPCIRIDSLQIITLMLRMCCMMSNHINYRFLIKSYLKEEILTFSRFNYDQEENVILPASIDAKHQPVQ